MNHLVSNTKVVIKDDVRRKRKIEKHNGKTGTVIKCGRGSRRLVKLEDGHIDTFSTSQLKQKKGD